MNLPRLSVAVAALGVLAFASCNTNAPKTDAPATEKKKEVTKKKEKEVEPPAPTITYHVITKKDSARKNLSKLYTPEQRYIIYSLNRIDGANSKRPDSLIVPDTIITDIMAYSPFPAQAPFLKDVKKIVFFSYPIQAFAAYENGTLVHWGPTNMGKKATPTPTGLFFSNWKSKETISTVDDEWKLKWNFNISNHGGVGWHQYAMPGYPASHSCLRMLEKDAMYMYGWADQWILKGADNLLAHGTPTIVFGAYPWGRPRPWFALLSNPAANTITLEALQKEAASFLPKIMEEQAKRDEIIASRPAPDTTAAAVKPDTSIAK